MVCKQMSSCLLKNIINKSYVICIEDSALNNLQWLICHKTQSNPCFSTRIALALNSPEKLICVV